MRAKELNDAIDQMHDSVESSIADNEAEMSVLKDKVKRYDELRTAVSLTSDEQKELSTLAQELQSVLGDEVTVVDQLTGKYNDLDRRGRYLCSEKNCFREAVSI